ncbi:class I adenylate-forming enzyme family protein [Pseudonocardia sp. MH-G8]|uniref:class I adenylate-forming enzyme family protein n=1 Tax=Pseudonocardia sp. MH-G8 TaxID=1854588 RepID=UPI000BA0A19C|nr:class I adenylate-forming enzyme family protein [Pseudonocardia sp. MH-G8]OZM76362.1 long-chain acyl-CoA synthetase [Pseudonocardia sp. MH-G8]
MTVLGALATARLTRRLWGAGSASLGQLAQAVADVHGPLPIWLDRPLAIAPDLGCELHWEHIARLVEETSGWLHAAGVRPGDTVAIVKAHNIDVLALAQAAARIGAVPALIAPEFDAATTAELLARLGNPVTIADLPAIMHHQLGELDGLRRLISVDGAAAGAVPLTQLRGAAAPAPRSRTGDQLVAITHTSGTTGVPKLIGHTGDSLVGQAAVQVMGGRLLLRPHDVVATCLTTAHARTLSGPFTVAAVGAPHLAMVDPDPAAAAALLARYRPTLLETFPNVFLHWEQLAEHPDRPLANVRIFLSTFDAAHPRTIRRMLAASRRRLPIYAQAYAQSELGAISVGFRARRRGAGRDTRDVGWPGIALTQVRLVDPATGRRVHRPGEYGRILARGPGLFAGYLGEPQRTRNHQLHSWWDTGDIGTRTRQLRLAGRAVDAIPALPNYLAVEDLLLDRLPELTELVLTTQPDQNPVPVVCTRDDTALDPARWQAAAADLPPMAAPRQFPWPELPTTATWKVRRSALQELLQHTPPVTDRHP